MVWQSRPVQSETDRVWMLELAQTYRADHLHVMDLAYRFSSWALDDPENTRLWLDDRGQFVAWAILQTPFWAIDYVCPPHSTELHRQILAWAVERAHAVQSTIYGRPLWFVNAFADQIERSAELETAGFACQADVGEDSWSKVWLRRPAELPVQTLRLPPGFAVRPLAGLSEVDAYVELHQAVFESKNMNAAWRARTLQHPAYRPDLDIVVTAPDGRLGAFCIGWLDGRRGQIEPLGCHADFRRHALGRLALAEVLRRLQAAGADEIFVETDNYRNTALALYEHMGFQVSRDVWVYRIQG